VRGVREERPHPQLGGLQRVQHPVERRRGPAEVGARVVRVQPLAAVAGRDPAGQPGHPAQRRQRGGDDPGQQQPGDRQHRRPGDQFDRTQLAQRVRDLPVAGRQCERAAGQRQLRGEHAVDRPDPYGRGVQRGPRRAGSAPAGAVREVAAVDLGAAVPDHRGDALAGEPVGQLLVGVAAAGQQLGEPGPLGQPVPQVGVQPGRQHRVDQQAEADQGNGQQAEHGQHHAQPQRRGPHGVTPTR
jgi:hypothetical protein